MRHKETVLGLLVLVTVLGGAYVARRSSHAPAGASVTAAPAGDAHGAPGRVMQAPQDDSALPDVTNADAVRDVQGVRITLSLATRPPVAFTKQRFRVRAESNATPVMIDRGEISFEMKMPMGDHRYTLVAVTNGWYESEVVLPLCPSGNPRWYAVVAGTVNGRPVAATFRLDLAKPGATPAP
jgi:hypothetical protein